MADLRRRSKQKSAGSDGRDQHDQMSGAGKAGAFLKIGSSSNQPTIHYSKKMLDLGAGRPRSKSDVPAHDDFLRPSSESSLTAGAKQQQASQVASKQRQGGEKQRASSASGQQQLLTVNDGRTRSRSPSIGPSEFVELYRSRAALDSQRRNSASVDRSPTRPMAAALLRCSEGTLNADDRRNSGPREIHVSSSCPVQTVAINVTPPSRESGEDLITPLRPPVTNSRRGSMFTSKPVTQQQASKGATYTNVLRHLAARRHSEPVVVDAPATRRKWKDKLMGRFSSDSKQRAGQNDVTADPPVNFTKPTSTSSRVNVVHSGLLNDASSDEDERKKTRLIIWVDREAGTTLFSLPTDTEDTDCQQQDFEDDDNNHAFVKLAQRHTCYELIPVSAKLVIFDVELKVISALHALLYNGIKAAPVWNADAHEFEGILTVTDFIKVLLRYYKTKGQLDDLEQHRISTWHKLLRDTRKPLVSVGPTDSLYEGICRLQEGGVHRVLVLDPLTGNPLLILTNKKILHYLVRVACDISLPPFIHTPIHQLGVGTHGNVATVMLSTPLLSALHLFIERCVSALPVVDDYGRVIDIYTKYDIINLATGQLYKTLDRHTVQAALTIQRDSFEGLYTCNKSASLLNVIQYFYETDVHRLVLVDAERRVEGIVALSDVVRHLVSFEQDEDISTVL